MEVGVDALVDGRDDVELDEGVRARLVDSGGAGGARRLRGISAETDRTGGVDESALEGDVEAVVWLLKKGEGSPDEAEERGMGERREVERRRPLEGTGRWDLGISRCRVGGWARNEVGD